VGRVKSLYSLNYLIASLLFIIYYLFKFPALPGE